MNPFEGRTILLGITGSIAAYKGADLASKLTQAGAKVDVVLTEGAEKFVTPLTYQSLTGRKAYTDQDLWGGEGHVTHIGLGRAADLVVVAPASANTLAKLANGFGDNLLTVSVLASDCPMVLAPAMDAGMFSHPATAANVEILQQRGVIFIGPMPGRLASGLTGHGRFAEPPLIMGHLRHILSRGGPLAGKHVVVTAGGTQEPIDPVRFITNRSSGKQGYAIAQAALDSGADVTLVTASPLEPPVGCDVVQVRTVAEMLAAVLEHTRAADALVMAAAPADFRPARVADQKIKKDQGLPSISLSPTEDILAEVAKQREKTGFPLRTIGFAAETNDLLAHAQAKLERKRLDCIICNDVSSKDSGFEVDDNRVTLLFAGGQTESLPLMKKDEVAGKIIQVLISWL